MIKKIVLTGGPSSGKTTVLEKIKETYESAGYKVIVVDETATYLILKGIKPFGSDAIDMVDFQELVLKMQLAKEEILTRAANMYPKDSKIIMVFDRGALDNCAYVNQDEFSEVLSRLKEKTDIEKMLHNYDLIINLVGSSSFYTTENNSARSENEDEAIELGKKTLKSWLGHPKLKIVMPKAKMSEKINEVLNIINQLLNEKPVKYQEKYTVDLEETALDEVLRNGKVYDITQDYLESSPNIEKRLRKVVANNTTSYSLTVYMINEDGKRLIVSERLLDKKLYEELLSFKIPSSRTIHKKRIYFADKNEFSLDIFDDDEKTGILEVNVSDNEKVEFPPYLSVMENVTNNPLYYNKNMALERPKEYKKEV